MVNYPMYCAWCTNQQIIGYTSTPNSHGICQFHHDQLIARARQITLSKDKDKAETLPAPGPEGYIGAERGGHGKHDS